MIWKSFGKGYILVVLTGLSLIFFIEFAGMLKGVDNYFYDLFFRLRGPQQTAENIIIVSIDEKTLQKFGRWPVRRSYYAKLLDRLKEARAVAFDIVMAEPSDDDGMLAEAIRKHGRVILPVYIDRQLDIIYPLDLFSPYSIGHAHVEQGIDGVTRTVFHRLYYKNLELPSFSSSIYELVTGERFYKETQTVVESAKELSDNILQTNMMKINYYGPPGTFPRVSMSDVIDGVYPTFFFKEKTVLVGITVAGVDEKVITPFFQTRQSTSGIEVHANILNGLLDNNKISEVRGWTRWLSVFILSLLCLILFKKMNEKRATFLWLVILTILTISVFMLFSSSDIWLSPAAYYLSISFIYVVSYINRLDEAARELDREYSEIISHMRLKTETVENGMTKKGFFAFLTPGGIDAKICAIADITDQFIFEKSLTDKALFSETQGAMLFDPEGRLILSNDQAEKFFIHLSAKTGTLESFINGLSPHVVEEKSIGSCLEGISEEGNCTFTLFLPGANKIYLKMDISSIQLRGDLYLLFVFADITKIKELELLKGQIVSMVSHELKTPITSIRGSSEILMDHVDDDMKQFAEIINEESRRLTRFVNTFLDISRMESGKSGLKTVPVEMIELIREVLLLMEPLANENSVQIKSETADFVTVMMIDRDLTKQCIINLAENAIKYSPPQGEVLIRLLEEKDRMRVDVTDKGCGIKEEMMGRIFEKFYRVESDNNSHINGSGLGLAFVKEAVELQGGSITVRSKQGEGAVFSIAFPKVS